MVARKPRPWKTPRLLMRDRNAGAVYLALQYMAKGARQIGTTRERIADICGLSLHRVGSAIQTLHEAHWINRTYGRNGTTAWYRITLPVVGPGAVARQTYHRERGKVLEKTPQGNERCGIENVPHPLTGIGGTQSPPCPPNGEAGTDPPTHAPHAKPKDSIAAGSSDAPAPEEPLIPTADIMTGKWPPPPDDTRKGVANE